MKTIVLLNSLWYDLLGQEVTKMRNHEILLNEFIGYLKLEKNYSQLTIDSYQKDLLDFFMFMDEQAIYKINDITYQDARLYLTNL